MRISADRENRILLKCLTAFLILFDLLMQVVLHGVFGRFSPVCALLSLGFSVGVLLLCMGYLIRQDRRLEQAARRIEGYLAGQDAQPIACDAEGQLNRLFHCVNMLASTLNAQAQREKQSKDALKDTISDISHQLKTPLATLNIYHGLIARADSSEQAGQFAAAAEKELDRMETLVIGLLKLARLDAGAVTMQLQTESVPELMDTVQQRFACRAAAEGKAIRLTGEEISFACDRLWLTEAFGNLVKNGLDHTETGGEIHIRWQKSGNILHFEVEDNGSGIHPEDMPHIYKRFYTSRFSRDSRSAGLGLPLAKTVFEAHGGVIEAESSSKGTVFSICFVIPTKL